MDPVLARSAARPLNPSTRALYDYALLRAYGATRPPFELGVDLAAWPPSQLALLRAAVKRAHREARAKGLEAALELIPDSWQPRRAVRGLSSLEVANVERVAGGLTPGRRALALLPLVLGLRARELLSLSRDSVKRAVAHGELLVMRKGGKEQMLPSAKATPLLEELLRTRSVLRHLALVDAQDETERQARAGHSSAWAVVGDILSVDGTRAAYSAYRRLLRGVGNLAGVTRLRPHLLRHAFASRMQADGADVSVIAWMLGHESPATTWRYLHPEAATAAKYLRPAPT